MKLRVILASANFDRPMIETTMANSDTKTFVPGPIGLSLTFTTNGAQGITWDEITDWLSDYFKNERNLVLTMEPVVTDA